MSLAETKTARRESVAVKVETVSEALKQGRIREILSRLALIPVEKEQQ